MPDRSQSLELGTQFDTLPSFLTPISPSQGTVDVDGLLKSQQWKKIDAPAIPPGRTTRYVGGLPLNEKKSLPLFERWGPEQSAHSMSERALMQELQGAHVIKEGNDYYIADYESKYGEAPEAFYLDPPNNSIKELLTEMATNIDLPADLAARTPVGSAVIGGTVGAGQEVLRQSYLPDAEFSTGNVAVQAGSGFLGDKVGKKIAKGFSKGGELAEQGGKALKEGVESKSSFFKSGRDYVTNMIMGPLEDAQQKGMRLGLSANDVSRYRKDLSKNLKSLETEFPDEWGQILAKWSRKGQADVAYKHYAQKVAELSRFKKKYGTQIKVPVKDLLDSKGYANLAEKIAKQFEGPQGTAQIKRIANDLDLNLVYHAFRELGEEQGVQAQQVLRQFIKENPSREELADFVRRSIGNKSINLEDVHGMLSAADKRASWSNVEINSIAKDAWRDRSHVFREGLMNSVKRFGESAEPAVKEEVEKYLKDRRFYHLLRPVAESLETQSLKGSGLPEAGRVMWSQIASKQRAIYQFVRNLQQQEWVDSFARAVGVKANELKNIAGESGGSLLDEISPYAKMAGEGLLGASKVGANLATRGQMEEVGRTLLDEETGSLSDFQQFASPFQQQAVESLNSGPALMDPSMMGGVEPSMEGGGDMGSGIPSDPYYTGNEQPNPLDLGLDPQAISTLQMQLRGEMGGGQQKELSHKLPRSPELIVADPINKEILMGVVQTPDAVAMVDRAFSSRNPIEQRRALGAVMTQLPPELFEESTTGLQSEIIGADGHMYIGDPNEAIKYADELVARENAGEFKENMTWYSKQMSALGRSSSLRLYPMPGAERAVPNQQSENQEVGEEVSPLSQFSQDFTGAGVVTYDDEEFDLSKQLQEIETGLKGSSAERLVNAVISTESAGNPNAVSPVGAQGLMQLMPATGKETMVRLGMDPRNYDPFDQELNVKLGTAYLQQMLDQFGDEKLALAAYNMGPGALSKFIKQVGSRSWDDISRFLKQRGWYKETTDYVPKVLARLNKNSQGSTVIPEEERDFS